MIMLLPGVVVRLSDPSAAIMPSKPALASFIRSCSSSSMMLIVVISISDVEQLPSSLRSVVMAVLEQLNASMRLSLMSSNAMFSAISGFL